MNIQVQLGHDPVRLRSVRAANSLATLNGIAEHLQTIALQAGAQSYLVLRIGGIGSRAGSTLAAILSSPDLEGDGSTDELTDRIGQAALGHVERTLVPLVHARAPARHGALKHLACVAPMPKLEAPANAGRDCVVFPVKLGALGNGMILLTGTDLNLRAEDILALHRRCYAVLKDLLKVELRKAAPRQNLNDRELECLQLAGEGLKSELIARRLDLSVHTINAYLGSATAKLDSVNRIQAIAKAIRLGYMA